MRRAITAAGLALFVAAGAASTPATSPPTLTSGERVEIAHPPGGHGIHASGAAVAVGRDGVPVVAWAAPQAQDNVLLVARAVASNVRPVRVNPEGTSVDSLHQPPGLAAGPGGEVYVTWSARKPRPPGVHFASDLYLSRSLDGGVTFDRHTRLNDDRPISHSFEGMAVLPGGVVLVAWIDTREGTPRTWLARVGAQGTRVEGHVRLEGEETCVCCRVSVAAGPGDAAVVLWRKVFPGNVRDMATAVSADGGKSFTPPRLVHADGWTITACPHRGGSVSTDARGRVYAAWYTEAREEQPRLLLAVDPGGQGFAAPRRLDIAAGTIPDHLRLAVAGAGRMVTVWEDATAVRRRVLLRYSTDGGQTLSAVRVLSSAIKAQAPDVVVAPRDGFVAVWHEEQFPAFKTIVQRLRVDGGS